MRRAAGWLVVERRNIEQSDLPLDPGEASAIRLAISVRADVLLLDERKARVIARSFGLKVAGVLGELLYAKGNGSIPLVLPEILKLRSEARFFIDSEIEHFILAQAGE